MCHEEHQNDPHENHGQVILMSSASLMINRHLAHALTPTTLTQFDVLVDLKGRKARGI